MRLSLESAVSSLRRIVTAFPGNDQERAEYARAIHEQFRWMDPLRFDLVCAEVFGQMREGRRPVPSTFRALYQKLDDSHGWSKRDAVTRIKCVSCGGTGFVYQTLVEERTLQPDRFVRPCPECRKEHPCQNLPIRQGWLAAESTTSSMEPDDATVRFIRETYDVNLDFTKPPRQVFDDFMEMWRKGPLKTRKGSMFGSIFGSLTLRPKEETLPAKAETVPPNVAHLSAEERKRLQEEAEKEGIPF